MGYHGLLIQVSELTLCVCVSILRGGKKKKKKSPEWDNFLWYHLSCTTSCTCWAQQTIFHNPNCWYYGPVCLPSTPKYLFLSSVTIRVQSWPFWTWAVCYNFLLSAANLIVRIIQQESCVRACWFGWICLNLGNSCFFTWCLYVVLSMFFGINYCLNTTKIYWHLDFSK